MVLHRQGPCWAVELYDYESHHTTFADAELTARDLAAEGSPYARPKREVEYCWTVECVCGDPLDGDDDCGPGKHYPLDWAEQLDAARVKDNGGLCWVCTNARLYGSVAGLGGSILPDPVEPALDRLAAIAEGQLAFGEPEVTA